MMRLIQDSLQKEQGKGNIISSTTLLQAWVRIAPRGRGHQLRSEPQMHYGVCCGKPRFSRLLCRLFDTKLDIQWWR